ncbi:hypothetical protein U9M48_014086 [Paspalum notatum var. saurae]|uniref:Cytochrome P450 n=1 Tax=Paspalum notatum var. saurae TaxID=547442 RepID=A0AAQ3T188_PASNO
MLTEETPWSSLLQAAVLLVAFLTISLPVLLCNLNASRHSRKGSGGLLLPPSPWRLPLVGNLHQLGRFPHRSLHSLAVAHGPVMRIHLGMVPAIVVSSADAAREVLQVQDHVFASRPSLSIPSILFYGCTDLAFAPHGPYWSRLRKLSVNHLLSPSRVRSCAAAREQEVEVLLRRVASAGGVVRLSELLSDFAKDVAGRIVLGTRAAGDEGWRAKLDALLEEIVPMLGSFHVGDCIPWLSWLSAVDGTDARARRAFQSIDHILDEIVGDAEREVRPPGPGGETHDGAFLHLLLSMMKEREPAGRLLDRDNVKALLVDLFGAGTEAMIVVLEWAMAELLCNKGAMQKLQQEVRRRGAMATDHNSLLLMVTDQDLPGMQYLRAVVKETLRLHTPGPLLLPHNSMQATRLGQGRYHVPSDTMVIVNAWAIARDPGAWESPEDFRPERFAGSTVDFRGQHFELIPFGSGRRMCPGMNLGVSTVELALANLVGRFDWELPVEDDKEKIDMQEAPGFVVRKKAPLRAVAVMPSGGIY